MVKIFLSFFLCLLLCITLWSQEFDDEDPIRKQMMDEIDQKLQKLREQMIQDVDKKIAKSENYLGAVLKPIPEDTRIMLDLSQDQGVLVNEVVANSPAQKAGLQKLDIILYFNNQPVKSLDNLQKIIASCQVGKPIKVVLLRRQKTIELSVTLEKKLANVKLDKKLSKKQKSYGTEESEDSWQNFEEKFWSLKDKLEKGKGEIQEFLTDPRNQKLLKKFQEYGEKYYPDIKDGNVQNLQERIKRDLEDFIESLDEETLQGLPEDMAETLRIVKKLKTAFDKYQENPDNLDIFDEEIPEEFAETFQKFKKVKKILDKLQNNPDGLNDLGEEMPEEFKDALKVLKQLKKSFDTSQDNTDNFENIKEQENNQVQNSEYEEAISGLGMKLTTLPKIIAERENITQGILIKEVYEDSIAEQVGVQKFDILIAIDDEKIYSPNQAVGIFDNLEPQQTIRLFVISKNEQREIIITKD
jgi:C-terminal processing protease CtpA/Prc